jgi:hypothetical protein
MINSDIDSDINGDDRIELYKLSPSLIRLFDKNNKNIYDNQIDWEPPKINGLNNSTAIIPDYQKRKDQTILTVDYYDMIIEDIRNFRKLNEYQLSFIKKLDDESKQKIIIEFNKLIDIINYII